MIRSITPDDQPALIALADALDLFQPDHLEALSEILAESFDRNTDSDPFWLTDDDGGLVGMAYCEPEPMTDRTWNLQLIGVHPKLQGQGRGKALLHHVEQVLVARGGRLLLVETSSSPDLESTRAFYHKCGYEEEARIRDFYTTGDDKVVYRKKLAA